MKNNTYSLPKILMTAYDTEEEIIESLEKCYTGRKLVDYFIAFVEDFNNFYVYSELLSTYRSYLTSEEIERLTASAKTIFDPELLTWLEE